MKQFCCHYHDTINRGKLGRKYIKAYSKEEAAIKVLKRIPQNSIVFAVTECLIDLFN